MEESIGGRQENCMRDWRLELNSQSGFSRMCEYGFFDKMDYLEIIVKDDENSKGGKPGVCEEMTSVLMPTEVQNNGGVQIRELQDYIVSVDTAKHLLS